MKTPLVSIVMSIYDTQAFLEGCLASIQAQTMADFECILVEDGSPDRCGEICDEWAARDPRFIALHKENGGVVSGWRMGIQKARGRWLVIVDSDDQLAPWALETELAVQKDFPSSMVLWTWSSDLASVLERQAPPPVTRRCVRQLGQMYLESMLYYAWGRLFDLELIRKRALLPCQELLYGSDMMFCVDYLCAALEEGLAQDFVQIDAPLYFYRSDNPTSLTTHLRPSYCADELRLAQRFDAVLDGFADIPASDVDRVLLHQLITLAEGLGYILTAEPHSTPQQARSKAQTLVAMPAFQELLAQCRSRKLYSPYLGPLRHENLCRVAKLYQLKQQKPRWYHRTFWAGYWLHFLATGRRDVPMF